MKTFLFVIIGRRQLCDQFFHFLLKHLFLPTLWSEDSQKVFKNLNNNVVIFLSNIKIKFKSNLQLFFFPTVTSVSVFYCENILLILNRRK